MQLKVGDRVKRTNDNIARIGKHEFSNGKTTAIIRRFNENRAWLDTGLSIPTKDIELVETQEEFYPGTGKKIVPGQAMRFNNNKPQLSFLLDFPNAIEEVCRVCEMGAKKYALLNWQKGLPFRGVEDSLLRHLTAFHNGEDYDLESKKHHLAHVAWNALALLEYCGTRPEFDNRKGEDNNG